MKKIFHFFCTHIIWRWENAIRQIVQSEVTLIGDRNERFHVFFFCCCCCLFGYFSKNENCCDGAKLTLTEPMCNCSAFDFSSNSSAENEVVIQICVVSFLSNGLVSSDNVRLLRQLKPVLRVCAVDSLLVVNGECLPRISWLAWTANGYNETICMRIVRFQHLAFQLIILFIFEWESGEFEIKVKWNKILLFLLFLLCARYCI